MNKEKENAQIEPNHLVDPKIEAIKEIIFGENIKEYESEFKKLSELINKHKNDLEKKFNEYRQETRALIEQSNEEFSSRLEELKKDTSHKINELNKAKLNRQTFGDLLKKLGDEIKS